MNEEVSVEALLRQYPPADRIQALQVKEAYDDLLHGSELASRCALTTFVNLGKTAEPYLLAALAGTSAPVTKIALEGLVGIRSERLSAIINHLMKSDDVELRMAAMRATNGQPEEQIRPLLLEGLHDPSPLVRRRVLSYLAWCDASWARVEILDRCGDPDATVRWAAVEALMSSDPAMAYEKLELMLPTLDPVRRRRAVSLLEQAGQSISADSRSVDGPVLHVPRLVAAGDNQWEESADDSELEAERDSTASTEADRFRVIDGSASAIHESHPADTAMHAVHGVNLLIREDSVHEAQEILAVVEDLQRCLEGSRRTNSILREELTSTTTSREEAVALARSRAQEVERLQQEIEVLQTRNEGLMVELGSSETERTEAIREIRRVRHEQDQLESIANAYADKLQRIEDAYAKARQSAAHDSHRQQQLVEDLERGQDMLRVRLDQRTRDLFEARAMVDDLEQEIQSHRTNIVRLEQSQATIGKIRKSLQDVRQQVLQPQLK